MRLAGVYAVGPSRAGSVPGIRMNCAAALEALESLHARESGACNVVPCHTTVGVLVVHVVRASRGQISGVLLTQEIILCVLEPYDVCSIAWYSSQPANLTFQNHHTTPYMKRISCACYVSIARLSRVSTE